MSDPRSKRIAREVQDVRKDKASLITVESVVADDLTHLKGTFLGPEGTPYEGGVFDVDIVVPPQYPFTALKMKSQEIPKTPKWQNIIYQIDPALKAPQNIGPVSAFKMSHHSSQLSPLRLSRPLFSISRSADPYLMIGYEEVYAKPQQAKSSGKAASAQTSVSQARSSSAPVDEIKVHGLDAASVDNFVNMGFTKPDIIDVMRRLNYRGANAAKIGESAVVEALLGGGS
ncbi:MAG: hypothetical protein CYPHOPRED_004728 [Cyphobasidiales sp. Tagirdzhanova-0007]|nr:MAG: hypothetical protein CYPHOPRED_004728 [Cyphobasidiales sp. Tagirdzhanova-0007]